MLSQVPALAQTYYVDPVAGSNTSAGTSARTPWRTPPGTRNVDDTNFISSAWGAINQFNRVRCGALILLIGGRTETRSQAGAGRLDPMDYFLTCSSHARRR